MSVCISVECVSEVQTSEVCEGFAQLFLQKHNIITLCVKQPYTRLYIYIHVNVTVCMIQEHISTTF